MQVCLINVIMLILVVQPLSFIADQIISWGGVRATSRKPLTRPTAERATGRQAGIIYLRLPRGGTAGGGGEGVETRFTLNGQSRTGCCDGIGTEVEDVG